MLDDLNVIKQFDPSGALQVAASQCQQAGFIPEIKNSEHDNRMINNVVICGMGGSALAALLAKVWLEGDINVPFEVIRGYKMPAYVGKNTLVIVSSYSGNTEETLSCLSQANLRQSQIAVIAAGGKLVSQAELNKAALAILPDNLQPRMAVIYNLCALIAMLANFGIISINKIDEISSAVQWLEQVTSSWTADIPEVSNYAKQLARLSVGKTAVFYGGALTAPVAYKWKISWNENAKNVAFWNELPEFNHNEFIGWTSHPIEKPFVIFDIISSFENPSILKRFEVSDKLLSGRRPKSNVINLGGDTIIKQLLWGSILADFVSIYLAILNGIDPTPVGLIEKLKLELLK